MKRILYLFILLGFNLVYAQTETFVISPGGQVSNTVIDNIGQTVTTSALSGGLTLSEGFLYNFDFTTPTVTLSDSNFDNILSNSDVVTITATFSESMAATPTLSLTGIVSDALMSATTSDTVWNYTWTVSGSTVTTTTATVSGKDLSGNAYSGTDSITFTIDISNPTLTIIKPTGTYTNQSVVVTLTYDEAVTGLTTDTSQF